MVVSDAAHAGRHIIVQLAIRWGARVIAIARTAEEAGLLGCLGATTVINLSDPTQPFTEARNSFW